MPKTPDLKQVQHRSFTITRAEVQPEARTVSLAISSEEPVERWWGVEVLDHSSFDSIVMDRAGQDAGLPLLFGHDPSELENLLGRVTEFQLGADRVLRGIARFATTEDAEQAWQLVQEGVLTDVSVGYRIHELTTENPGKPTEIQRATKWEPLEVSLVAIPADCTVGVGRDLGTEPETVTPPAVPAASTEVRMDTNTVAAHAADPMAERQETLQIQALGERLGVANEVREILATVSNLAEARQKALALIAQRAATPAAPAAPIVDLGKERYSISRALLARIEGRNCMEMEVSQEIAKKLGRDTAGFFVPTQTRANPPMDTATSAYGQKLVWTEQADDFITILRNKLTVLKLGARFLTGLRGNVGIPRQLTSNTATWLAENPGSAVTATAMTTDILTLTPKQLVGQTSVTRTLLAQSSPAVDALINDDLAGIHAVAYETAAINGAGTPAPLGILGTSGIGSVAGGTNGLQPTYGNIVDLESAVAIANADMGSLAYLTTPAIRGRLKQTQQFSSTNGASVWDYLMSAYPNSDVTNSVPSNLTKGTASGICHAILFGNFSDLILAEWGAFELITDPLTQAGKGLVVLTSNQLGDVGVRRAGSFAAMKDALQ